MYKPLYMHIREEEEEEEWLASEREPWRYHNVQENCALRCKGYMCRGRWVCVCMHVSGAPARVHVLYIHIGMAEEQRS